MNADDIREITAEEEDRIFGEEIPEETATVFRPEPEDEIERLGREIAYRILEAGVNKG